MMGINNDNDNDGNRGGRIDEHNVPPPREHTIDDDDDENGGDVSTSTMFLPTRKRMIQDRYGPTSRQNGGDIDVGEGWG